MIFVLFLIGRSDWYVVQVKTCDVVDIGPQAVVDAGLQYLWRISQAEGHTLEFKLVVPCSQWGFVLVSFIDSDGVVENLEVLYSEDPSSA
jgi:hypothetical protein